MEVPDETLQQLTLHGCDPPQPQLPGLEWLWDVDSNSDSDAEEPIGPVFWEGEDYDQDADDTTKPNV